VTTTDGFDFQKGFCLLALRELGIKTFHAKISMKNEPSIRLFETKLAYYPVSCSEIFQETTLEWSVQQPGNDEEGYGAKATALQKQACQALHDSLMDLWTTGIDTLEWE
jgi:hypothetical protein